MNSLRAKLALLIVGAIISVVGLATLVTLLVASPPEPHRVLSPTAGLVLTLVHWAESLPNSSVPHDQVIEIRDEPLPGELAELETEDLRNALADLGEPLAVQVTRPRPPPDLGPPGPPPLGLPSLGPPPGPPPGPPEDMPGAFMASVPLKDGQWLIMPLPDLPRGPNWRWLLGWSLLLVAGAAAVALFVAHKMTRPFALLESSIASVGQDGVLPMLPESGPAEVRATAKALNRLSRRLRSAMESRMRLVAAAGHDLRTPMTRMRLRAEFLGDDERGPWLKDLEELDHIADSAMRLVQEEVADVGPESLRLDRLVAELVAELSQLDFKVTAGPLTPATVSAWPLALTRALRNLAINAATHGGGGRIGVMLEGPVALVTIDDEGPGIPEELLERVFEPFFRVDPARRHLMPGAGLGLAIAKEIVGRHHGTITVANKQPRGLRQEIRLPLTPGA